MPRPNVELSAGRKNQVIKSTEDAVALASDTDDLAEGGRMYFTKAVYVGVTGNLKVLPAGQTTAVTYYNIPVGKHVMCVKRIYSTGTTADEIITDYDLDNE